jgi:hypothetical protein
MSRNDAVQLGVSGLLFHLRHHQSAVHSRCHVLHTKRTSGKSIDKKKQSDTDTEAPWVDLERLAHIGGDAHELTQHERGLLCVSLSDDELH